MKYYYPDNAKIAAQPDCHLDLHDLLTLVRASANLLVFFSVIWFFQRSQLLSIILNIDKKSGFQFIPFGLFIDKSIDDNNNFFNYFVLIGNIISYSIPLFMINVAWVGFRLCKAVMNYKNLSRCNLRYIYNIIYI